MQKALEKLIIRCQTELPSSILEAVKPHVSEEVWEAIKENARIARENRVPFCQDTGIPIFFVEGMESIDPIIRKTYASVAKKLPMSMHFRSHTHFSATDLPIIYHEPGKGRVTYLCKGIGAELYSAVTNLSDYDEIPELVRDTVAAAGTCACPPYFIGVGIGSSLDHAAFLAKKAHILRGCMTPFEKSMTAKNVASVRVMEKPVPSAGIFVAVDLQCWANRFASIEVRE